jgi:hypothetical protein
MIRLIGFIWLVAICAATESFADERTLDQLRARTEVSIGNARYRADVYEPDPYDIGRVLEIRCIEGCREERVYTDEIGDHPHAIFHLARNFIISIWSGGSVSRVRVHHIDETGIREVLEVGYRGAPEFTLARDYKSPVIAVTNWEHPLSLKPPIFRETWRWNGKEFKMNKRCIENCWPNFFGN